MTFTSNQILALRFVETGHVHRLRSGHYGILGKQFLPTRTWTSLIENGLIEQDSVVPTVLCLTDSGRDALAKVRNTRAYTKRAL